MTKWTVISGGLPVSRFLFLQMLLDSGPWEILIIIWKPHKTSYSSAKFQPHVLGSKVMEAQIRSCESNFETSFCILMQGWIIFMKEDDTWAKLISKGTQTSPYIPSHYLHRNDSCLSILHLCTIIVDVFNGICSFSNKKQWCLLKEVWSWEWG